MSRDKFERAFPNLKGTNFVISSPATGLHNCIAYAAGDEKNWWWPEPKRYWPIQKRETTRDCFLEAFRSIGFEVCESAEYENGFTKIALFEQKGIPSHMAKLLGTGQWRSKCGPHEDITHDLTAIEGDWYGSVVLYMKRKDDYRKK